MSNKKRPKKPIKLPFPTTNQKLQVLDKKHLQLQAEIDQHGKDIEALSKSHDWQISLLGNFATHDLKNYIHSIDGIVSTSTAEDITEEQLDSIRYNIPLMRQALANFSKLVIHNDKSTCKFDDIVQAIQIINRDSFVENNINFTVNNQSEYDIVFEMPFTSMLQLLNNLVINATKALETTDIDKKIEIVASLTDTHCLINVQDNGVKVTPQMQDKLFEHSFSTTGGSGIGLYHARYLCTMYHGSINYYQSDNDPYKGFLIALPLRKAEQ